MHDEAHTAVARMVDALQLAGRPYDILDIGGRPVNGDVRDLFHPDSTWTTLDVRADEGVDIVADAATWVPSREWEVVVSTECFEHTADWPQILRTMHRALASGGYALMTMATDPRGEHSGIDGCGLRDGEHYANVAVDDLRRELVATFAGTTVTETHPRGDLYAWARK